MLSKPVESIIEAENRAAESLEKAREDSRTAIENCRAECEKMIHEREMQADEISRELLGQNEAQIKTVFVGADVIAEDKLKGIKNAAESNSDSAIDSAIEIIAKG